MAETTQAGELVPGQLASTSVLFAPTYTLCWVPFAPGVQVSVEVVGEVRLTARPVGAVASQGRGVGAGVGVGVADTLTQQPVVTQYVGIQLLLLAGMMQPTCALIPVLQTVRPQELFARAEHPQSPSV